MGGFSINSSPESIQKQLDIINSTAKAKADQENTNEDVKNVKENLYKANDGQIASKVRGLGPSIAKNRLESRGVDTDSLITGAPSANEGYKKGGHAQKSYEKISLKHCKTNTAEHGNSKHKHCW